MAAIFATFPWVGFGTVVVPNFASALVDWLRAMKDPVETAHSLLNMLVLVVGSVWAYLAFGRKREKFPRASIKHKFSLIKLDEAQQILRVELEIENLGDTLLKLDLVLNRIQQVLPLANTEDGLFEPQPTEITPEIEWPLIAEREIKYASGERELEPKEPDAFQFDYILGSKIETVVVYSYVKNCLKKPGIFSRKAPKEVGWMKTETLHLQSFHLSANE
jgi:hypothetical protein